jgi:hypothetical protein
MICLVVDEPVDVAGELFAGVVEIFVHAHCPSNTVNVNVEHSSWFLADRLLFAIALIKRQPV